MKIKLFLGIIFGLVSLVQAQVPPMSLKYLLQDYFASMEATSTNITVTFKSEGFRYLIYRNNIKDHVNQYNETLSFSLGEKIRFEGLDFEPLEPPMDQHGFLVTQIYPLWDPAAGLAGFETNQAILLLLKPTDQPEVDDKRKLYFMEINYDKAKELIKQGRIPDSNEFEPTTNLQPIQNTNSVQINTQITQTQQLFPFGNKIGVVLGLILLMIFGWIGFQFIKKL